MHTKCLEHYLAHKNHPADTKYQQDLNGVMLQTTFVKHKLSRIYLKLLSEITQDCDGKGITESKELSSGTQTFE